MGENPIRPAAPVIWISPPLRLGVCVKPTLFAERGGRGTGERHTVPPKAERMVLLEVALERLEVALNW